MADETKPAPALRSAAPTAAIGGGIVGASLGAVVISLVQGNPAIITRLLDYSLSVLTLGGLFVAVAYIGPPFIAAQRESAKSQSHLAESIGAMSASIQERFRQEDDVRSVCRALTGVVERMGKRIEEVHAAVVKRPGAVGGN